MIRCLTLASLLAAGALAAASPADRILVQGHRGAGVLAPENTLEAFELAWSLGATPEADLRATRDGVIVAFHDGDFRRVVWQDTLPPRGERIEDLDWRELETLRVGRECHRSPQRLRIPALREVFAVLKRHPERELYIDIKKVDLPALAALGREHGVERQLILASTHHDLVRQWRTLAPTSQTLLWMGGSEEALGKRLEALRATGFAGVTQLQIHTRLDRDADGRDRIRPSEAFLRRASQELKARGILFQSLPWDGRKASVYRQLLDWGVESFATDHPDVTLPVMRAHRAARGFLRNGVTAHRGSSLAHPENTLAAFEHALALGADWIELDIFTTRDGHLVVHHDASTGRTAERDLRIADSTLAELRALDVAHHFRRQHGRSLADCPRQTLPLLAEALELIQTQTLTRLSIQPKDGSVDAAVALIRARRAERWCGFNDGSLPKMRRVKELAPELTVFWDRPAGFDPATDLPIALDLGFEALVVQDRGVTAALIARVRQAGLEIGAWTVNDPARMRELRAWGIDRIYTDDPAALLQQRAGGGR